MRKTLFIDFDDTLHDSDTKYMAKLDGLLGFGGAQLWEAYLSLHRQIVHHQYPDRHDDFFFHMKLLFDWLKRPYDEAMARRVAVRFREAQEECWTQPSFFPDSLPFLDGARERGHRLCLATGDYARQKAEALEKAGGKKYFERAFDRTELGIKGESTYFRKALSLTGSLAEQAVAVGDSLSHDIAAAKAVGIKTIWVNRKGDRIADAAQVADHEVKDLIEALEYI